MPERILESDRQIYDRFCHAADHLMAVVGVDDKVVLSAERQNIEEVVSDLQRTHVDQVRQDVRVKTIAAIAFCDTAQFMPEDSSLEGGNYSHG